MERFGDSGVRASRIKVVGRSVGGNRIGRAAAGADESDAVCCVWCVWCVCNVCAVQIARDLDEIAGSVVSRMVAESTASFAAERIANREPWGCSGWPWLRQLSAATLGAALCTQAQSLRAAPPTRQRGRSSLGAAMPITRWGQIEGRREWNGLLVCWGPWTNMRHGVVRWCGSCGWVGTGGCDARLTDCLT